MKKSLIAVASSLACGVCLAATAPMVPGSDTFSAKSPYAYELGLTTHHEGYEEFETTAGKLMQEEALLAGVKGSVSRAFGDTGGTAILAGEFAHGTSDYTGAWMGGRYGDLKSENIKRDLLDVSGMYMQTRPEWNGFSAGLGLGYRRLVDHLQSAPGGYQRINEHTYLALALEQTVRAQQWTITPGLRYMHNLSSKQKSDLDGGVTVRQRGGYGAETAIAFEHKVDAKTVVIKPFFRMWSMHASDVSAGGLYEPRNMTREGGMSLTYRF